VGWTAWLVTDEAPRPCASLIQRAGRQAAPSPGSWRGDARPRGPEHGSTAPGRGTRRRLRALPSRSPASHRCLRLR
jgi:hypothetical protein